MEEYFRKFLENLALTSKQKKDAKTKYRGVCKALHADFYTDRAHEKSRFLFGSYKTKTAIRPFTLDQDVDVLFKIPKEDFEKYQSQENGPSNLLTRIKNILKEKYATTEKINNWGKVVVVKFKSSTHNVEVLPAFEQEDDTFIIPNTEDGGRWENFDPRSEVHKFKESNKNTKELTRELVKMLKRWKIETVTLSIKSFKLTDYVIEFLTDYTFETYPKLIYDFFCFLDECEKDTPIETAKNRSQKAYKFFLEEKIENAVVEYRKIFGGSYPKKIAVSKNFTEIAPEEEFIEDQFIVELDPRVSFKLDARLVKTDGFREFLSQMTFLPKERSIVFEVTELKGLETTSLDQVSIFWKIRNFGAEAKSLEQLRGEILKDGCKHEERSLYAGEHYVECYIIVGNRCIARKRIQVPIR